MATKSAKRKVEAALEPELATTLPEFVLTDFRVLKIMCERFRAPEESRRGSYTIATNAEKVDIPEIGEDRIGTITYSLAITGNTRKEVEDEKDIDPQKSFTIEILAEGKFDVHGAFNPQDSAQMAELLRPTLALVHALCVHHSRVEADSLGFRSVRPSYAVRNMPAPTLELL